MKEKQWIQFGDIVSGMCVGHPRIVAWKVEWQFHSNLSIEVQVAAHRLGAVDKELCAVRRKEDQSTLGKTNS